jgi:mannose-6-phosphate isomerase
MTIPHLPDRLTLPEGREIATLSVARTDVDSGKSEVIMAIERAYAHALPKPWGVTDLRPWNSAPHDGGPIGEIWYERSDKGAVDPSLQLKLLFTSQPLSIQVHPDDAFALTMGLPNGKTEAWYVLHAEPGAKVAVGLTRLLTTQQLGEAIDSGTISDLVRWQTVVVDDVIFVPAGTIHAIGAGLIIAEIQQRSDLTFRLFDYGRQRELHVERAMAVANAGPAVARAVPRRLTESRTVLEANPYFVFERFDLGPDSAWCLDVQLETWFLVTGGGGRAGSIELRVGDAIFLQSDRVDIRPGPVGMVGLAAYPGGCAVPGLLRPIDQPGAPDHGISAELPAQSFVRAQTPAVVGSPEITP